MTMKCVGRGFILDWLDLENFVERVQKWRQHSCTLLQKKLIIDTGCFCDCDFMRYAEKNT